MKTFFNRLSSNRNFAALLLCIHAWGVSSRAAKVQSVLLWAVAGVLLLVALGLILRQGWARKIGLGALVMLMVIKGVTLVTVEFKWRSLLHAVGIGIVAYYFWKEPDKGLFDDASTDSDDDEDPPKPLISLVHLRSEKRYLEAPVLANALSEAWGLKITGEEGEPAEDADGFVAGTCPLYVVMLLKPSHAMFLVHNHDESYFAEPDEVSKMAANLRFAQIIREHRSWLAIDLMKTEESTMSDDDAYRMIGKAISAVADDKVMAIACPQHNFFNLWSPDLERLLCSESPLSALQEEVMAPVYEVPEGELIEQSIAEARRRWPEFVTAFLNRQPGDDRFIVKAPFRGEDDGVEHMWLQVFGLEPEYVHGHLINDPIHTTKLKKGSQVEVPAADVSDWVCPDSDGNPLGNFTQQAVAEAARRKSMDNRD